MDNPLTRLPRKVQEALDRLGVEARVVELPASTRTAAEAAAAVGCRVGQIAKSLVFCGRESGNPALVIASGGNRVNEERLAQALGETAELADPEAVRGWTGYPIGGVPPVGHAQPLPTYIDEDLLGHAEIWAAAGTPRAVVRLTPDDLLRATGGRVIAVV